MCLKIEESFEVSSIKIIANNVGPERDLMILRFITTCNNDTVESVEIELHKVSIMEAMFSQETDETLLYKGSLRNCIEKAKEVMKEKGCFHDMVKNN